MSKYVYQIQGALENPEGILKGLRILVCNADHLEMVDVPIEVLTNETAKFLQFRIKLSTKALNIQNLPVKVQNDIRAPLGRWLDQWVLENFYGDNSKSKSINP